MAKQRGETAKLTVTITDSDGDLYDPTTVTVGLVDPLGAEKVAAGTAMTTATTGVYTHPYNLAADAAYGDWVWTYTTTDGTPTETQIQTETFVCGPDGDWPVTLDEAKLHLKVDFTTDDNLIETLLLAATQFVEVRSGLRLLDTTEVQYFDTLGECALWWGPLDSITSITYVDTAGDTQTLSSDIYWADTTVGKGYVRLTYGQTWPSSRGDRNNVAVTYVVGYGDSKDCPGQALAAIKLLVGHWYENRESVSDRPFREVPQAVDSLLATISEPRAI